MKRLFVIVFLFIMSHSLCSQTVEQVVGMGSDYMYRDLSLRNTPLFNAQEIKARNIRSCTIVHPWFYWDKNKEVIDTLYVYDFDETGNIKREISFRTWGGRGK